MNEPYTPITEERPVPPPYQPRVPFEEHYAGKEVVLAISAMVLGFFFVRFVFYHVTGLFTTLLFCAIITACLLYLHKSGKQLTRMERLWSAMLYGFSLVYVITANSFLKGLNTIWLWLNLCLLVYHVCDPAMPIFRYLFYTIRMAVFAHPFAGFGKTFAAIGTAGKEKGRLIWKNALYILGGLLLAVPLTLIVGGLLSSSDENMARLLDRIWDLPMDQGLIFIPHIIIGMLLGCYFFGMLYTNVTWHIYHPLTESECERRILGMRFLPNPMVYAAVTPICVLYVLFFISQMQYFLGGFTGSLAEGFTYAGYARQGFFELCTVCCINAAVIAIMSFLSKISGVVKPLVLKLYTLFLCICSLFLAGTAIAKMCLYIGVYGMTQLRIYTSWFMLLLMLSFVLIAIRQFRYQLPVCKIGFVLFAVMFGLLCFSRPDAWITRYNAEMSLAGELEELDTEMIYFDMSADAAAVLSTYPDGTFAHIQCNSDYPVQRILLKHVHLCEYDFYERLNLSAWILLANEVTE